jgi:hypothetical protein
MQPTFKPHANTEDVEGELRVHFHFSAGLLQAMTKVVLIFTIILAASLEDRIIANSEGKCFP